MAKTASWSTLLLFCAALCLPGCSLLPRASDEATADNAPAPVIATSQAPSFEVQVHAPKTVRDLVQSGEASAGVAISALKTHGSDAPKVLQQAAETAKNQGQTGVSKRHLPEEIHKKAVRKAAPMLLDALTTIKAHKSYKKMPDDLRELVEGVLQQVKPADKQEKGSEATA